MKCTETKFRAYCTKSKKFLKGDFSLGIESGQFRGKYGEVFEDVILQQFTGLKDIYGNDVYEGDVLRNATSKRKEEYTVVKVPGMFKLKSNKHDRLIYINGIIQRQMLIRPFEIES